MRVEPLKHRDGRLTRAIDWYAHDEEQMMLPTPTQPTDMEGK